MFTCIYHSAAGLIRVSVIEWEDKITLETKVPKNIRAEIDTSNLEQQRKEVEVI